MAWNSIMFRENVLCSFFRKSRKRDGELDFWGAKNASNNDENDGFRSAPRTIRGRRSGLQTGAPNQAKCRKSASKSPRNEHEKMWHPILQWSKIHAVVSPAKMHQNAFIFIVPGFALLTPWMQKTLKIVENWPQNNHKKCDARFCNGQKRTPSNDLQKCVKTRSFLLFPVLLCSRHGCKHRSKSSKIIDGGI